MRSCRLRSPVVALQLAEAGPSLAWMEPSHMRTVRFKATIQADGTVVLPQGEAWMPGEAEITVVQHDERPERPWMQFVGTVSDEDTAEILAAIEESCETIDPDGW